MLLYHKILLERFQLKHRPILDQNQFQIHQLKITFLNYIFLRSNSCFSNDNYRYSNDFQSIDCRQYRLIFDQIKRFRFVHEQELRCRIEASIGAGQLFSMRLFFRRHWDQKLQLFDFHFVIQSFVDR